MMANVIGTLRTTQSFGRRAAVTKIVIGANRATQARIAGAHGAPLLAGKIARQRSDFGSVGLSALRMSGGLVGTSAPGWIQGDGRLAVVLCGMDEGIDFGRGPHQAGLADPAAGAACLASVPKPDHDDHTSSARQITHCRRVTTLSWCGCTSGCSPEPWLPPPSELVGLAYGMDAAGTSLLARQ